MTGLYSRTVCADFEKTRGSMHTAWRSGPVIQPVSRHWGRLMCLMPWIYIRSSEGAPILTKASPQVHTGSSQQISNTRYHGGHVASGQAHHTEPHPAQCTCTNKATLALHHQGVSPAHTFLCNYLHTYTYPDTSTQYWWRYASAV